MILYTASLVITHENWGKTAGFGEEESNVTLMSLSFK